MLVFVLYLFTRCVKNEFNTENQKSIICFMKSAAAQHTFYVRYVLCAYAFSREHKLLSVLITGGFLAYIESRNKSDIRFSSIIFCFQTKSKAYSQWINHCRMSLVKFYYIKSCTHKKKHNFNTHTNISAKDLYMLFTFIWLV